MHCAVLERFGFTKKNFFSDKKTMLTKKSIFEVFKILNKNSLQTIENFQMKKEPFKYTRLCKRTIFKKIMKIG